jgi:glutamyl-tRNA reductase
MKRISVIGLNYLRTPVEIREKFYFTKQEVPEALKIVSGIDTVSEATILSTCNRTEAVIVSTGGKKTAELAAEKLYSSRKISHGKIKKYFYNFYGADAVRHVFNVASGLDSMVVGESEVTGQFKDAYNLAATKKTTGAVLLTLYQAAMAAVKKIRAKTSVSRGNVSVSYCAVNLATQVFHGLSDKKVLIIGAGEMANSAATGFIKKGAKGADVINKTYSKAVDMAEKYGGRAYGFDSLEEALENADIVLCSTASPEPVLTKKIVGDVMSKRAQREIFIIDIAVPRDVEDGVKNIKGVHLYDIDDLKKTASNTGSMRKSELVKAGKIVIELVKKFEKDLYMREAAPLVGVIKRRIYDIAAKECAVTAKQKGLSTQEKENLEKTTIDTMDRIIAAHMAELKKRIGKGDAEKNGLINTVKEVFKSYE